jgi:adenosylcobalamin-dependent ribonucleoside-triphosphate reductase
MLTNYHSLYPYRNLHPGIGQAVFERTYGRKKPDGSFESWGDVAHRVALGNSLLCKSQDEQSKEYELLRKHIANASILMSGRHLQHGDESQPTRPMEVFTNCSTSATSFVLFYLLMSGSGVGRCYDDDLILTDWDNAPALRVVLSQDHKDFDWSAHESVRDALHKYGPESKNVMWFQVPDSREGWAQALEVWENAAFEKIHKDKTLILDFSGVRPKGSAIAGMQNRPSSGPVPLMNAFMKAASLKGSGIDPWKQSMYIDHYFAECVLVGGARRSARMSTKTWRDRSVIDFIRVKRPVEFNGLTMDEVVELREKNSGIYGFLWSSNNSVTVDEEFWRLIDLKRSDDEYSSDMAKHARKVWKELTSCAYADGTGEPGIINVDKLIQNNDGWQALTAGDYVGSKKYQIREESELYMGRLAKRAKAKKYNMIVNPCGEIALSVLGGYCVIGDVVPFHCDTLAEVEEAVRATVRALIRVNTMDALYKKEVTRTNRIGVGLTGVHEFAWKFFKVGFRDLVNPDFDALQDVRAAANSGMGLFDIYKWAQDPDMDQFARAKAALFWKELEHLNWAVKDEAVKYAKEMGVNVPHTMTTVKPSGTVSKLFGLTEGWHLPSMAFYMRWVQFRYDDPLVETYKKNGYPVRELKTYEGTVIVGFPTSLQISTLGMNDKLVCAGEATPEEQYKWLQLGERFWIKGQGKDYGNQISYTLKYDPKVVDYKHFADMLKQHQRTVRAASVMPQADTAVYEYQPEEAITKVEYEEILQNIEKMMAEEISREHIDCSTGACPIDFKDRDVA